MSSALFPSCTCNSRTRNGSHCQFCGKGSFQSAPILPVSETLSIISCELCPVGRWDDGLKVLNRTVPVETCTRCKAGKFGIEIGSFLETEGCFPCPPGRYTGEPGAPSLDKCKQCHPGSFSVSGARNCSSCKKGRVSLAPGSFECTPCSRGRYETNNSCILCESGRFNANPEKTFCKMCPRGKTSRSGATFCSICQLGEFLDITKKPFECQICPSGHSCVEGTTEPTSCPPGKFASVTRAECKTCGLGMFSPQERSTSCNMCPPGTYQDARGSKLCISCPEDSFSGYHGNSALSECTKCSSSIEHTGTRRLTKQISIRSCICNDGYYPYVLNGTLKKCNLCPVGATCVMPNASLDTVQWMAPKHGFWKIPWETPFDQKFVRCSKENMCTPSGCVQGTEGVLCEVCSSGYAKQLGKCYKCNSNLTSIAIALVLLATICMFIAYKRFLQFMHKKKQYAGAWREFLRVAKISVDFMQIGSAIPVVLAVHFPPNIVEFTKVFDFVNVDILSLSGVTCFGGVDFIHHFLYLSCLPISVVIAGLLAQYFRCCRNYAYSERSYRIMADEIFAIMDEHSEGRVSPRKYMQYMSSFDQSQGNYMDKKQFHARIKTLSQQKIFEWWYGRKRKHFILNASTHCLLFIHTPITRKVFEFFNCHPIHSKSFLKSDYSIECESPYYKLTLPYVIIICLGFSFSLPVAIAVFLFVRKNRLREHGMGEALSFLYEPYRNGVEGWEVLEIFRKTLLTGILIYLQDNPVTQLTVGTMICACACCLLNYFQPHKNREVFWLTQVSYVITLLKFLNTNLLLGAQSIAERDFVGFMLVVFDCLFFAYALLLPFVAASLLHKKVEQLKSKRAHGNSIQQPAKPISARGSSDLHGLKHHDSRGVHGRHDAGSMRVYYCKPPPPPPELSKYVVKIDQQLVQACIL